MKNEYNAIRIQKFPQKNKCIYYEHIVYASTTTNMYAPPLAKKIS